MNVWHFSGILYSEQIEIRFRDSSVDIHMELIRYQGKWFRILAKPYEPERQTYSIAWMMARQPDMTPESAYKKYFETLRDEAKVFYPSFRKENAR